MSVWSEAFEDQLIDMIEDRPPLYDVSEKLYANRVVKTELWREIEHRLDVSEKELKKKWDSLRTQYTRYKKLAPPESGGAQKTGRQQWILSRLQFLEPHTKRKENTSNHTIKFERSTKDILTPQQDSEDVKPEIPAIPLDPDSGRSSSPAESVPAVRTTWSVEKEDKFVELWQQHDCLYDSADRYSDRLEREKKWSEIATALELPVQEVKIRATTLRTQYSRLVKPRCSGRKMRPMTARQRRILRSCEFLKKHINHRPSEGNFNQSIKDMLRTEWDSSDSEPENTALSQELDGGASPSPTESSSVSSPPPPPPPLPQLSRKQTKPPNRSDEERRNQALLEHLLDVIQETGREPKKDCEDSFGVTIAMELKRIRNPALRNRVKRQIMTILYDALDSEQMTEPVSYQHTFPSDDPHSITVVIP
ncbi:uncharacterized protein wu:fb74b10 [Sebastes umbrosus]|uniref:uncharacterized protein wu:fb74b10 n=1 Tax=Sebastes umbrosus TaxID=72105 RepID=UPI0018A0134C|nr:uncharacterized protein wu:fb74b10 [Sebastes umbrosus]